MMFSKATQLQTYRQEWICTGYSQEIGIDITYKNKQIKVQCTSEADKKRSLSVYCCTCSRGWPVKAAYILSIFCSKLSGKKSDQQGSLDDESSYSHIQGKRKWLLQKLEISGSRSWKLIQISDKRSHFTSETPKYHMKDLGYYQVSN